MTIMEAIARVDESRHNTCSREEKIRWLSQLDGKISRNILLAHEGGIEEAFSGYCADTPGDTPLLVGPPFEDVYLYWLEARICYCQGEFADHNAAAALYNRELAEFEKDHKKNHMPRQRGKRVMF